MNRQATAQPPARAEGRDIKTYLERSADRLAAVLPRHMTPEKQIQIVATMVYKTPKLAQCDPASIVAAVMEASELGLSLSRSAGEAWLVPYWNSKARVNECQFQPGYKGLVKLAYQSNKVAMIDARPVFKGDVFRFAYTPDLEFYHEPRGQSKTLASAYAYAKLSTGERLIRVLDADEVERVRLRSKSADAGPWQTDYVEMALKTAVRRLCKMLPKSEDLIRAIEADEREYLDGGYSVVSAPPGRHATRTAALEARLGLSAPRPEPEFDAGQGVPHPLYSEPDDDAPEGTTREREREPGEDG